MSDRIDTDAPWWVKEEVRQHAEAVHDYLVAHDHPGPRELVIADLLLLSERVERLLDEVDALRFREVPGVPLEMLRQVREAMEDGGFTPTTNNGWIGTVIDIRNLAERQVPDGHVRIDGKLFRLERHGDLNRYGLVPVSQDTEA